MQKKFQIFVSSTYQDLIEERRAVIEAILDLGHIPIGMEAFQASNEEQWSYIKKRIDEADYYVVIVAERYGSTNDQGVSFTEMEYDYAREKGVPVAAFLLHEHARSAWRKEKADALDNRGRAENFRKKCEGLMVRYWRNKDELASACVKSISQMMTTFPRDGWIPARDAMRPEVANELARLSDENQQMRIEYDKLLNERETSCADFEKITHSLTEIDIITACQSGQSDNNYNIEAGLTLASKYMIGKNLLDAFRHISSCIILGNHESNIAKSLQDITGVNKMYFLSKVFIGTGVEAIASACLSEYLLHDLVQFDSTAISKTDGTISYTRYWRLTKLWVKYLNYLRVYHER